MKVTLRHTGISESEICIRRKSACQCPPAETKTAYHHPMSCSNCCKGVPWFICPSFEFSKNRLYLASKWQFLLSFGLLCSQTLGITASWIVDADAAGDGNGTQLSALLFWGLSPSSGNVRLNAKAQSRTARLCGAPCVWGSWNARSSAARTWRSFSVSLRAVRVGFYPVLHFRAFHCNSEP